MLLRIQDPVTSPSYMVNFDGIECSQIDMDGFGPFTAGFS